LCLGAISHKNVLHTLGIKQSLAKFTHGAIHQFEHLPLIIDSYHTSRYNINTGVLSYQMFCNIINKITEIIK
jgi:uracil-DNA glycosylase